MATKPPAAETVEVITLGGDDHVAAQFTVEPNDPKALAVVVFDGTGSSCTDTDRIIEYLWDFDDHTQSVVSTPTVEHNFPKAGEWIVRMTIRTQKGYQSEVTKRIRVGFRLELNLEPRCPMTYRNVQFVAKAFVNLHAEDGLAKVEWDLIGDGKNILQSKDAEISHIYVDAGNYTAKVRVTSVNGVVEEAERDIVVYESAPQFRELGVEDA